MPSDLRSKCTAFRALHSQGCFILPNPWDLGGIRRIEKAGFKAMASTSAGAAWAMGRNDGELSRDDVLEHLRLLCRATELPVNGDFESGFANEPEGVATNVALALETGVAGLSIEDRSGLALYEQPLAVDRIKAAHEIIVGSGVDVMLVGRSEGFLIGRTELTATIDRLIAYAEAGADCLYAPGLTDLSAIRTLVSAVATQTGQRVADRSQHASRRSGRGWRQTRKCRRRSGCRCVVWL